MSKTDPSSSNASGDKRPGRADGDAGRQGSALADQPEQATRPAKNLDDSWALSAAMPVPQVPGVTDASGGGDPDALYSLDPAPPMIPAAAPSGAGSGRESAAASVVARAAALRALGAKTMQGFGPAPINRGNKPASGSGLSGLSDPANRQESSAASSAADLEEEPTNFVPPPAAAPAPSATPATSQAPLYLDDPPDMLRLSTGTSDISVPEIDPGVSASMRPNAAHDDRDDGGDGDDDRDDLDGDSHDQPQDDQDDEDDDHDHTEDSMRHDAGAEVAYAGVVAYAPDAYPESSDPFPQDGSYADDGQASEHDEHGDPDEHDGQHAGDYHDGGYGDSAPEAQPPVAQLLAPTTAARRAYGDDGVPRAEADWFEPSGAQQMADGGGAYGHTAQQHDLSFTEPSRRNRTPGPNRWIAPAAVVVAIAAVVFAGGYFYTRGEPASGAQQTSDPAATQASGSSTAGSSTGAAGSSTGGGASSGATAAAGTSADPESSGAAPSSTVAAGLVDVRFDSTPPGAMVMLVDRGRGITSPVGTTPVRAALEPKGTYDAIFTLEGHPTKVVSLAGPKAARVVADLNGTAGEQVATTQPQNPPPNPGGEQVAKVDATTPDKSDAKTDKSDAKTDKSDKRDAKSNRKDKRNRNRPEATAATGGGDEDSDPDETPAAAPDGSMGSLSISAKPPCEIAINGKATGRTTPVRDLPLSVGIHKITFINKSLGVNETIAVRVTAGKETKVAQDYTGTP